MTSSMKILIINRRFHGWNWRAATTNYHSVIDHRLNHVFYVVDSKSIQGLDATERQDGIVFEVDSLDNHHAILDVAARIVDQNGHIDRVIALNEDDLSIAAIIRERYAIQGHKTEYVERFRNKHVMKSIIQATGLRTPAFMDASDSEKMVAKYGFPLFLKPLDSNSSKGVMRIENQAQLDHALAIVNVANYQIEVAVSGPIFHLDGVAVSNQIKFCQVYRYYNSCYAFAQGNPVGVLMNDNAEHREKLVAFAGEVLEALDIQTGVFHLELFLQDDVHPAFLEIGARVGGAFVSHCIEHVHAVSLFEEAIKLELDHTHNFDHLQRDFDHQEKFSGWLLFPEPKDAPVVVTREGNISSLDGVSYTILPKVGDVLDGKGGYIKTSGTFLLDGNSMSALQDTIERLIGEYSIESARC